MDKDRLRNDFNDAFYRSLEDSKIEITAIPVGQLQALSRACADAVFATLNGLSEEQPAASPAAGEQTVWSGGSWMTLGLRYELTSQRLRIFRGVFSRSLEEIDLVHVRDVRWTQTFGERLANVGDVTLVVTQPAHADVKLENIKDPAHVRELIREAYLAEQKRRGLLLREES